MEDNEDYQTPALAAKRYQKTLEGYMEALKSNPDLRFKSYCETVHTRYRATMDWACHHGYSLTRMRAEAKCGSLCPDKPGPSFIQIMPSAIPSVSSPMLEDVTITFKDGVSLTLRKCSISNVISLMEIYRSRSEKGGVPCSL